MLVWSLIAEDRIRDTETVNTFIIFVILLLLIPVLWKKLTTVKETRLPTPPSPPGRIPVLGHLWKLDKTKPFETIDKWSKECGDLMTVYFGSDPVVVISRWDLIRQAFLVEGENFSGRPSLFVHESCWGKGHTISDGPRNALLRKHLMTFIRIKTRGPHSVQDLLNNEIERMHEYVEKEMADGKADLVLEDTVFYVVGNVLTQLVMGRRHEHGSIEFRDSARWLGDTMELMEKTAPLTFLPWLRHLPGGFGYETMKEKAATVNEMMMKDIRQRKQSRDYKNEENTDLTSHFLRLIDEDPNEINSEEMLAKIMTEMFFAGIQTECNTFGWAFLFFLFYPEEQEKCRKEMRFALTDEESILWCERRRLPYLEACIAEVQRLANIAPFSMPHKNHRETVLNGYRIPANSTIFMNLYSTLADPKVFEEPFTFKPSRFLDNGVLNRDLMNKSLPYGMGPRMCLGESIARCELFCVIGSLLRTYSFEKVPGETYSLEQKMELTIHPDKYKIRFIKIRAEK